MTPAETQLCLTVMVYGLATASTLVIGYLAWRKIRPHRRRYHYHQGRNGHQKGVWGWE
jgi:cytochrome oxidase assembly protein ShyY1